MISNKISTDPVTMAARSIWAKAQKMPMSQRWDMEAKAYRLWEASHGEATLDYFSSLMEDAQGWAFAYGFTVYWHPTRGAAKRQWYACQRDLRESLSSYGPQLGPKPIPCLRSEAVRWQEC